MPGKFERHALCLAAFNGDSFFALCEGFHIAPVKVAAAFLLVDV
jgi:hypothetical protein